MSSANEQDVGTVELLFRYPVKSMLGEAQSTLAVVAKGAAGDRAWALLDDETGQVASAKRPKLWRSLLNCTARTVGQDAVTIAFHDGTTRHAGDPALDSMLSSLTGRPVRLAHTPPADAEIVRSHPEAQIAEGLDVDVAFDILKLGGAAPPGTFLDYAPLHLITTATLDGLADAQPEGTADPARYRPNIVIRSPAGTAWFPENAWLGGTVQIGEAVTLRIVLQTPRCAIPSLAHGALPPMPQALRVAAERNRVDVPGFGFQPCAGVYAEVIADGTIQAGDRVTFVPA